MTSDTPLFGRLQASAGISEDEVIFSIRTSKERRAFVVAHVLFIAEKPQADPGED
jgi:hypothetical protein